MELIRGHVYTLKPTAEQEVLLDGETTDDLYAFLTTEPNAIVAPIHPKAMPVILTEEDEFETWLAAPWAEAKALQRPLGDDLLKFLERPD